MQQLEITDLHKGDEVLFCEGIVEGVHAYDPFTASVRAEAPVNLRRAVVIATTDLGGVLLYVLEGPRGLRHCKHWCPISRIWTKTGEWMALPPRDDMPWSDESETYYEREQSEANKQMMRDAFRNG